MKTTDKSDARVMQLLARGGHSLAQIAKHLERSEGAVYHRLQILVAQGQIEVWGGGKGTKHLYYLVGQAPKQEYVAKHSRKPLSAREKLTQDLIEREKLILKLVSRSEGVAISEMRALINRTDAVIHKILMKLRAQGKIEMVGGAGSKCARYYLFGKVPPEPVKVTRVTVVRPVGETITPEGIKITKCPSWTHDPRYQMPPGTRIEGEFSKLGMGRYL